LQQRMHENWNQHNDSLKKYYDPAKHDNLSYQFGNGEMATFGTVNEIPAKNLRMFQTATAVLSKFLWCIPLLFLFALSRRTRMRAVKPLSNKPH
jgi:hypothetical protein